MLRLCSSRPASLHGASSAGDGSLGSDGGLRRFAARAAFSLETEGRTCASRPTVPRDQRGDEG